jgi:hypothetical protein
LLIYNRRNKAVHDARTNTTRPTYNRNGYWDSWFHNISYSGDQGNLFGFFIKPTLSISIGEPHENDELRWGPLTETRDTYTNEEVILAPPPFYTRRRFVDVVVKNTGRGVATNCEVRLRLLTKTDGCQALSTEDKIHMWNDSLTNKTNIGAKYGKTSFTLAFSQERFTHDQIESIGTVYCGVKNEGTPVYAWIGTQGALVTPENHIQDSLCQGEFRVHVGVMTETGQKASSHFIIKVGSNWKSLTSKMDICDCIVGST